MTDDNRAIVDGKVLISEINDLFGLEIDDTDVDTIGGWMLTERYNIRPGEQIEFGHCVFTVIELDGHHVKKIEVTRRPQVEDVYEEAAL